MKTTIAMLIGLLAASPASATSWSDADCSTAIRAEGKKFVYVTGSDEPVEVVCTVVSGEKLSCEDGTSPTLKILDKNRIDFNGVEMFEVGSDAYPWVCD